MRPATEVEYLVTAFEGFAQANARVAISASTPRHRNPRLSRQIEIGRHRDHSALGSARVPKLRLRAGDRPDAIPQASRLGKPTSPGHPTFPVAAERPSSSVHRNAGSAPEA